MKTPRANIILGMSTLVAVSIIATGCATNYSKQRNKVYQDWSRSFAELGVFPVFPPREDVVVGDVWALPLHPYSAASIEFAGGLGKTGIWLDRMATDKELASKLSEQYRNSFYLADTGETPAESQGSQGSGTSQKSGETVSLSSSFIEIPGLTDTNKTIFDNYNLQRARQVAFPEFSFSGVDQGALSALIPIEALQASFGINHSKISSVTVKVPAAESYGLPLEKIPNVHSLIGHVSKSPEDPNSAPNVTLSKPANSQEKDFGYTDTIFINSMRSHFNEALANLKSQVPHSSWVAKPRRTAKLWREIERSEKYVWLAVVSEVFMARQMDITINHTSASSGALQVSPISDTVIGQLERLSSISEKMKGTTTTTNLVAAETGPTPSTGNATNEDQNSNTGTDSSQEAARTPLSTIQVTDDVTAADMESVIKLAEKLQAFNQSAQEQTDLGGSLSVVSVSARSVGLRKTYQRPIVVGVRGAVMKLDAKTGKVVYHSNTHRWAIPTTSFNPKNNPKPNSLGGSFLQRLSRKTSQNRK